MSGLANPDIDPNPHCYVGCDAFFRGDWMQIRRNQIWGLLAILATGFLLRTGAAVFVQRKVESYNNPAKVCLIDGDASGYWALARAIAAGEQYTVYDPPRRLLRMPGFPAIIAGGIKLFGEHLLPIRILLAGVGTLGCLFIYLLSAELFDRRIGLWAAALTALSPPMIVFSVLLLSEIPFATTIAFSLWLLARLARSNTRVAGFQTPTSTNNNTVATNDEAGCCFVESFCKSICHNGYSIALIAGLGAGVATLVRPTWLLIAPGFSLLFMLLARDRGRAIVQSLLLLSGLALALAPWTARNYRVTGHVIPTTLWVGASMYDGLNPEADGGSNMQFVERDGIYKTHTEYDADRYYREAAGKFARENPGRTVQLGLLKLWRFWNPLPNAEQFSNWYITLALAGTFLPALVLALVGLWRVRHLPWCWLIPLAPILYFSLVHMVFVGSIRYRLPAEPPLLILTTLGLLTLFLRHQLPTTNQQPPSP